MKDRQFRYRRICIIFLPCFAIFVALCAGRYNLSPLQVFSALMGDAETETINTVIMHVRLPRVLLALLVGAGLSVSGASFQAILSNPLASPDITGVASGAAFGAALGLLISGNMLLVQMLAMLFGCVAIGITFLLSRIRGGASVLMIVLSGVIVSALFTALVSFVKYVADPLSVLPTITFWLMGSLTNATYGKMLTAEPAIAIGLTILLLLRWRLNILTMRDDEITALGVNPTRMRWVVILSSTLIVASCVSICGQIGWIGLVIPHIARAVGGPDNQRVIPICLSIGAAYMLLIDTVARTLSAAEIPLSILTAMAGAPIFIVVYLRHGREWL